MLTAQTPSPFDLLCSKLYTTDRGVYEHIYQLLGPFYGAIAVPSATRCRCCGHRCAGSVRQ